MPTPDAARGETLIEARRGDVWVSDCYVIFDLPDFFRRIDRSLSAGDELGESFRGWALNRRGATGDLLTDVALDSLLEIIQEPSAPNRVIEQHSADWLLAVAVMAACQVQDRMPLVWREVTFTGAEIAAVAEPLLGATIIGDTRIDVAPSIPVANVEAAARRHGWSIAINLFGLLAWIGADGQRDPGLLIASTRVSTDLTA